MSNRKGKGQNTTRAGLAEFFGVAMPTIDHWVRTGCPAVERGGRGKAWTFNTADVIAWREQKLRDEATGTTQASADELKLRQLAAKTAQAELELAKSKAEVAPLWQIEKAMQKAFAEVRANMRNIPSRAARLLIGENDEVRFKRVLLEEIDQALDAMAEADLLDNDDLEHDEETDE
jgi:phage terminase Nu1 subunit (DNA packaging protein)